MGFGPGIVWRFQCGLLCEAGLSSVCGLAENGRWFAAEKAEGLQDVLMQGGR